MYDLLAPRPFEPAFAREATSETPTGPAGVTQGAPQGAARAASAGVLARMLDIVDYGLLLVHDDGHVVFANQVARSELAESHPLQLHGKQLRARRPDDLAPLRAAISSACRKGLQKLVTLGTGRDAVSLSVVPVNDTDAQVGHGAMLLFGKRRGGEDLSTEAFARHYKLTAAELRVLKALCAGRRPSAIAREQGVALCTVRTQIGCAREKTGAGSIGELIRQVAELPPMQNAMPRCGEGSRRSTEPQW